MLSTAKPKLVSNGEASMGGSDSAFHEPS